MPGYLHSIAARLAGVFRGSMIAPRPPPEQRRKTPMTVLPVPTSMPTVSSVDVKVVQTS